MVLLAGGIKAKEPETGTMTPDKIDHLGITHPDKLSAASERALEWPEIGNEWFIEFKVFDLKGDFAYEAGVVRRDPSAIIKQDGR